MVIPSPNCRSIVSHIVWYSPPTPEITIGVVSCNLVWWNVNVKTDVKASYGFEREPIEYLLVGRGD